MWKVIDSTGKPMGGTGKRPCKLYRTAQAYVRVLMEQFGRDAKFRIVES